MQRHRTALPACQHAPPASTSKLQRAAICRERHSASRWVGDAAVRACRSVSKSVKSSQRAKRVEQNTHVKTEHIGSTSRDAEKQHRSGWGPAAPAAPPQAQLLPAPVLPAAVAAASLSSSSRMRSHSALAMSKLEVVSGSKSKARSGSDTVPATRCGWRSNCQVMVETWAYRLSWCLCQPTGPTNREVLFNGEEYLR